MKKQDLELKTALYKLVFFEPNLKDEKDNQVLDYLILDCLSTYSPMLECRINEIQKYIKTTFYIDFDDAEILNGTKRLQSKSLVAISDPYIKHESPRIKLIKSETQNHGSNIKEIQDLEDLVFAEWADLLKDKYKPYINNKNIENVIESFKIFLTKMFVRHGKESVTTLYPDNPKINEWVESIQSEIIKDLPRIGKELDLILQIEIPIFFKSDLNHRKSYLNSLFNASFLWHLIQVDETCSEYFKETTKGQILVLDNNILFSLIGFHGTQLLNAVHNLIKYANTLEYKLVVTTKTLDEFYESIQRNCEKIYEFPRYTKNIASAAIATLESSNFIVSYWKEFVDKGLSIEEFAVEKSHIKQILDSFNISISDEFRDDIEKSEELKDEESLLRESCGNSFSQTIIEHDAFHRIFIKRLRKSYKYKYSEATAWFLTHDSKLPVYAHHALKGKKALHFCISTNEWIQINRPFLNRSQDKEDFETSFHVLVTQPYLRSVLSNFKVDVIKEKLLSRLNKYNNIGTQLAFDLATDTHFLVALSKIPDEKTFDEKIDAAIIDINKNLKAKNKEIYELIEKQELDNKKEIQHLYESLGEVRKELSAKNDRLGSLTSKVSELLGSLSVTKDSKNNLIDESDILKSKIINLKVIIRWGAFIFLFALSSLLIWNFEKIIHWQWLVDETNKIILKIITNILITFILINIPLYRYWKIWLTTIIAFLIALFTIACT